MTVESLTSDQTSKLEVILEHFITSGGVLKDAHGFTDGEMEAVYSVAYNLHRAGQYEDARKIFKFLCFFDHLEKKYWLGLGATQQLMGRYEEAVQSYSYACLLDIHDPRPAMYAADCYIAMGNKEAAQSALYATVEFSGDQAEHTTLRQRAETLLGIMGQPEETPV